VKKWKVSAQQILTSSELTDPVHAESASEFRLTLDLAVTHSVWTFAKTKVWTERSSSTNEENDFTVQPIFGLSPNLGLSVSLGEKWNQLV